MAALLEQLGADEVGIEPVGPSRRVLGTWDNVVLWADLGVSFLVMVVGTFLVPALGLGQALAAIVVGALVGNLLLGLAARIGAEVGTPTMVLLRGPLGRRGSYLPTVMNILQLLGWATLEIIVMAQAADMLASRFLGLPSSYHVWVAVFTALTLLLALGGPVVVTTQLLKRYVVWAVLLSTVWITIALFTSYDAGELLARPGQGGMSFWSAVDLVVALPISWFPLVADYSRFSRDRTAAFWGTAAGYFVPQVWFYALGAMLALAAGSLADPTAPIAPLLAAIAGLTAGWLALLVILVDETDESFANVYSTALSIKNLWPGASQRGLIIGISALVLIVAWTVPLVRYELFLYAIGSVFVPLLGVLAADYYLIRGGRYAPADLLGDDPYPGAFNWLAIVAWLGGAATYVGVAGVLALEIPGLLPDLGGSLPSLFVAFVLYAALGRVAARRPVALGSAGR
jgi:putative hydroxymethylpyrimidine transporter CytX